MNSCFVAGTLISTTRGNIAIERLTQDDHVLIHAGTAKPVLWIGVRHIDTTRHPEPEKVWPVRILAGAIADGVPAHDLYLSPDHAVFLDGLLIPAKVLVNGVTITTYRLRHIIYYHVEVEGHDVVLAEGLPVETYLNTGNRAAFENHDGVIDLHPDFMQSLREAASCAPFAESGPQVIAIRQRLLDRLAPIPMSGDPDLKIRADGRDLPVERIDPATYRVTLPPLPHALELLSRAAVPAELTADPDDRRSLGVSVQALRLEGDAGHTTIDLAHAALSQGWWGFEGTHRWTDGAAIIPAELIAGHTLTICLSGTMTYRLEPNPLAPADRPAEGDPLRRSAIS